PSWGKVRHISRTSWDTSPEAVRHISRSSNGTPQPNYYKDKSAPCRIRTCDLVLRRHPLWSTELRGLGTADYKEALVTLRSEAIDRPLCRPRRSEPDAYRR